MLTIFADFLEKINGKDNYPKSFLLNGYTPYEVNYESSNL